MKKRRLFAQLVAVANRAANDAALHVATPFVRRVDAIADQKCGSANVIGNNAQALVVQVGLACLSRCSFDQCIKNINFIIAVNMLQDGGQTLKAHAGIHTRGRQLDQRAVGLHVELHEHVVPDFNETVAVFIRAARWPAWNVIAVVVKDLAARAAWPGICHHPEVV